MSIRFNQTITERSEVTDLAVSVASAEKILSWSYGEVNNPVGFNLITGKPEISGLFCARAFGPIKDKECLCSVPTFGTSSCLTCGVEFVSSWCRRKRFGHIELAVPVIHTWFYKLSPNVLALLLSLPAAIVQMIVNYDAHLITASKDPKHNVGSFISTKTLFELNKLGLRFEFESGAIAIKTMLSRINVLDIKRNLCSKIARLKSKTTVETLKRRLEIIDSFAESKTVPEHVIVTVLPVLPPGLRPALILKDNRYASSDLNELYRQVLIKNKAVKAGDAELEERVKDARALQHAVDALFDNSKTTPQALGYNNCALKSLTDMLRGKNGRFRQNLLGKRVDYSGRSVIAPGPELKLNECGLPEVMAMELFKPFVQAKAIMAWNLSNEKEADVLLETAPARARAFLEEVVEWHPVLLNRAPTLHKLSFQAFRVRVVNSKVIRLHPLVCAGFNADFDGDQMAVHVPLTREARAEAVALMMSTNNALHPAHGSPAILPTQDMILGLYYMSLVSADDSKMCFSSYSDVSAALTSGLIKISTKIRFNDNKNALWESTPGRLLFNELIPLECRQVYDVFCPPLTKAYIYDIIDVIYHKCGIRRMTRFCVDVMSLGFKYASKSGISIGRLDFPDFNYKRSVLSSVFRAVSDLSSRYRVSNRWELWSNAVDSITHGVDIELLQQGSNRTSIQIVANSGARGTRSQLRQLVGMKGFVYGFGGKLCLMPVLSSYREGLSAVEFFYTSYGSRRGLIDTALKTASSGYFTRKLVEVARDCVVYKFDCRTSKSVRFDLKNDPNYIKHNLISRTLAKPITRKGKKVLSANTLLTDLNIAKLLKYGGKSVNLRSPITCECAGGVCSLCYGADLSTSKLVRLGQAVGIIAAQSIGEPGTQLTLRAFHDTGVAKKEERVTRAHVLSPCSGVLCLQNLACVFNATGDAVVIGKRCVLKVKHRGVTRYKHRLRRGDRVLLHNGAIVNVGSLLSLSCSVYSTRMLLVNGALSLSDVVEGVSSRVSIDDYMGFLTHTSYANSALSAKVRICAKPSVFVYYPSNEEQLAVISGTFVNVGDVLSWKLLKLRAQAKPRQQLSFIKLANIFENRARARELISPFKCRIRLGQVYNDVRTYVLEPLSHRNRPFMFSVKGKPLGVLNNEIVQKGKTLIPGELDLCRFVNRNGLGALTRQFVAKVQEIYNGQGVSINSKHIEVILTQMTRYSVVISRGSSGFSNGERVYWASIIDVNYNRINEHFKFVKAQRVILGISRICATQRSLLSAMAYQGSISLLVKSAIAHANFELPSVKERVMLGALVPIGTGIYHKA